MKALSLADRVAGWLANLAALAAAAALVLMMVHVFVDVIGRYVFNSPIEGTLETVQIYYMVMVVVLPFAYVTRTDGQIIVALFTQHLAPRRLAALDAAVGMVTLLFLGLMTWMSGIEAVNKTALGEVRESGDSVIIQWPTRWFVPIGAGIMALAVLIKIIGDIRKATSK